MKGLGRGCACWLFVLVMLAACAGTTPEPPGQGESAAAAEVAFEGEYNQSCFNDDLVDLNLQAVDETPSGFLLTLVNKTASPMRVLWGQVVFLDASGNAQHMIHQGVALGQPLEALTPSTLDPGASLSEVLKPAKAMLEGDVWRLAPLGRGLSFYSQQDQRLRIDLPLEINGKVSIYRFRYLLERPGGDDERPGEWGR